MARPPYTAQEKALRLRSRIALYTSLAITAAAALVGADYVRRHATPRESPRWAGEDFSKRPEVLLLQRYLQIDTSQPNADELSGAMFLRSELESAGIPVVLENLGERRANLWAILEGKSREAVVLHHHIDTDPVPDPDLWEQPPFSGAIDPPVIWGRGAFDMKSVAIAQLVALLDLKRSGKTLERSVIFLATGSEEIGSATGTRHVLDRYPELVSRFWVFLTEGGVVEALNSDEIKYWGTEIAQRRLIDLRFEGPTERLSSLRDGLQARGLQGTRPALVPEVAAYFQAYAASRGSETLRALLLEPERLVSEPDRFAALPGFLRALLVDELVLGNVEPLAANPGESSLRVRVLLLPGRPFEGVAEELIPAELWRGLRRSVDETHPPSRGSPTEHAAFRTIAQVLQEGRPGIPSGPVVLGSVVTDSRFVRARGIPAFGFSPFQVVSSETLWIGRVNERLSLAGFVDGVQLYSRLLERLATDK